MEIHGLNKVQQAIADLLWSCEDSIEVEQTIETFGADAVTVYEMMMAAYFDDVDQDLDPAVLERISGKH